MTILKIFLFLFLFFVILYNYFNEPKKVIGREIYISSQPEKVKLLNFILKYKIKSVINLRGENIDEKWYIDEKNILEQNNLVFFSFKLSKDRPAPIYELKKFLNNFENIKYPVLIHCKHGVDRSSFFLRIFLKLKGIELDKNLFLKPKIWDFFDDYKEFCKISGYEDNSSNFDYFIRKKWVPEDFSFDLKTEVLKEDYKNKEILFSFEVVNKSKKVWQLDDLPKKGIRLGAKLFGPFAKMPENLEDYFYENESKGVDVFRAGLIKDKVMPGGKKKFYVNFKIPSEKGSYFLAIDIVDENINWFYYYGKPPYYFCFEVF